MRLGEEICIQLDDLFWSFELDESVAEVEGLPLEKWVLLFGGNEVFELGLVHLIFETYSI